MKTKEFFNLDHASAYLNGSLVRYNGEICFVDGVGGSKRSGFSVNLADLISGSHRFSDISVKADGLDMNSPPLGFVNVPLSKGNAVVRAMRIPSRTWKIGLTVGTLFVDVLDRDIDKPVAASTSLFHHDSLRRTILGNFPSFTDSINHVAMNVNTSMAFSRRFAVRTNGSLYHIFHGSPVGTFKANGSVELLPTFKFLKESLDRTLAK